MIPSPSLLKPCRTKKTFRTPKQEQGAQNTKRHMLISWAYNLRDFPGTEAGRTFAEVRDEPPPHDVDSMEHLQSEVHNQNKAEIEIFNQGNADIDGNGDLDSDSEMSERFDVMTRLLTRKRMKIEIHDGIEIHDRSC